MSTGGHRRTASTGRWRGWDRKGVAPVEVRRVEPTREAEPMTEGQAAVLRPLCLLAGERFNPSWSKRQASARIKQLRARAGR